MRLDAPNDVSITGFDAIELARIVTPALTTVHVPHREMGRKAAIAVVDMVEDNGPAVSVERQSQVIVREYLGPNAKKTR